MQRGSLDRIPNFRPCSVLQIIGVSDASSQIEIPEVVVRSQNPQIPCGKDIKGPREMLTASIYPVSFGLIPAVL